MIEIPIEFLLDDKAEIKSEQLTANNKILQVPAFHLGDYDVWGATAMILSELKDLCKITYSVKFVNFANRLQLENEAFKRNPFGHILFIKYG